MKISFTNNEFEIRRSELSDLLRIMEIYSRAQDFMRENGNPTQWGSTYPPKDLVSQDISSGRCHVIINRKSNQIVGVFSLFAEGEPAYKELQGIEGFAAIHRVASDGTCHGLVGLITEACAPHFPGICIDTHRNNTPMQHALKRAGFEYCGTIFISHGDKSEDAERLAFRRKT